jgi:outer membrane protein assembly factor BamB
MTLKWRIVVGKGDASPALVGDRVYVFARQGDDEVTIFYTASSPMIVDGKCIAFLTTKNGGALTAFDLASGEPRWEWTGAVEPYGSPVLMVVNGLKTIVTPTQSGLVGVGLADGKLLWQVPFGTKTYQSSLGTPIVDGTTVVFFCGSGMKQGGSMAVAIEKQGDSFTARELWRKEQSAASFSTPVLKDGLLFGVNGSYFCMDARTGAMLWQEKLQRPGSGSIVDAGGNFFSLNIDSTLVAFKADRKRCVELASYQAADSATWAYPIISGNRVYVKDTDTLTLWTVQ